MTNIIDLDVLIPQPVIIKFGENQITIQPPSVADTIMLGHYTDKMQEAQAAGTGIEVAVASITQHLYKLVPELSGATLNKMQLQMLINIIVNMNTPQEKKDLAEQGISTDSSKKV